MNELREEQDFINFEKLSFVGANKKYFDFRVFKDPIKFASVIYDKGSLKDANDTQKEMLAKLNVLKSTVQENQRQQKKKYSYQLVHIDCIIPEMKLLKHLKMVFFYLRMDFKKKSQTCSN